MKVLWLTNIPSPYRVNFFNELGKYCELTVLFERSSSDERDDSWSKYNIKNFKAIFLNGKSVGVAEAICFNVIKYLNKTYDHIVVTNFSDPTGIIAIIYLKMMKIPYEIESDGGFAGTGKGFKENLKKFLLKDAKCYFSSGFEHDNYYLTYGAKKEKIKRYPFTSIYEYEIIYKPLTQEEKEQLKYKLGIREDKVILSVGQFIHRKGYDILLEACKSINNNVGIYIIGGKPTDLYLNFVKNNKLENIHFLDFKEKKELEKYYLVSDLFVHPTREDIWGLVINEAFSKGLPIITTDKCIAGQEMIVEGINGSIIKTENISELKNAINTFLNKEHNYMESTKIAKQYTIENMVKEHLKCWQIKKDSQN